MRRAAAACIALLAFLACRGGDASRASDSGETRATQRVAQTGASTPDTQAVPPGADSAAVEVYSATEMSRIATQLTRAGSSGRTFGGHPTFHYVESRRVASGTPEIHDDWTDVTLVQAGRAALLTGGRVTGGTLESAGEHRGGAIVGGTPHPIAAGDLVVVPPGVPHQFQLARGDSIRYLTIKIKR